MSKSKHNQEIMNLIKSLDPFTDESLNVYICRSRENANGEKEESEAPLHSPQSRRYIKAIFAPLFQRGYLSDPDTRTIMETIEGYALTRPVRKLTSCNQEVVEQKPLALAVRKLAEQGPTRAPASSLLAKLNTIVRVYGIKVDQSTWPTTEDALGAQLADLVQIMLLMGVLLIRHENARPRAWTICLVEDAPQGQGVEGDDEVSPPTHSLHRISDQSDTSDTSGTPVKPLMLGYAPSQGLESASEKAWESKCTKNSKQEGGQA